jgi:hypothetical protein
VENQQKFHPYFRLLPIYFKKIGIGIFLFAIIVLKLLFIYLKGLNLVWFENYHDLLRIVSFDIGIIGLLLFAFAKDKIEDELTFLIRLQSLAYAFTFTVLFVVIKSSWDIFRGQISETEGGFIITLLLVVYILEKQLHRQQQLPLFPNYFKKIGIGFVLFAFIILTPLSHYWKTFEFYTVGNYKDTYGIVFFDILIVGLLLYSMAKEKVEDELITLIRLQSIARSFILGIVFVIGIPIVGYIWKGHIQEVAGQVIIFCTLCSYIFHFNSMKKNT